MCRVDKLCFAIQERTILQDISFTITAGEKVSIVGPNGGGKTMLLRMLIGAIAPSSGTIALAPGTVIGYQPQQNSIDPSIPLSARALLQLNSVASASDFAEIAELLQLKESILDSQLTRLSGGERQLILIARAMLRRPQLLILDEPGTYCDNRRLAMLYGAIERFSDATGCAILCVSHDLSLVLAHTDHTMCIDCKLMCEGGPEYIVSDPKFMQLSHNENVGIYKHRHDC